MENAKKKFYQKNWFMWLWLILFPPIGLILLWTCHKDKKKKTKIILSVVFIIWFVILMGATNGDTTEPTNTNPTTEQTQNTEQETESKDNATLPSSIESSCRKLTKKFIEGAVGEDYSMLAFNVEEFELDDNEDGTIKILYMPSNAGEEGATKVNLTISKNGNTYTVEYALLAGLYEVELNEVADSYKELITE